MIICPSDSEVPGSPSLPFQFVLICNLFLWASDGVRSGLSGQARHYIHADAASTVQSVGSEAVTENKWIRGKDSPFASPHPPFKDKVVLSDIAPFFESSGFPIGLCCSEPNSQFSDMESLFTKDVLKKVDGTEASGTKVAIVKFVMCQQAHRAIAWP